MNDADGPLVAQLIYEALFPKVSEGEFLDHHAIPYALDDAIYELRKTGATPARWAPYIHMGI
jgi:hypothetical protein